MDSSKGKVFGIDNDDNNDGDNQIYIAINLLGGCQIIIIISCNRIFLGLVLQSTLLEKLSGLPYAEFLYSMSINYNWSKGRQNCVSCGEKNCGKKGKLSVFLC